MNEAQEDAIIHLATVSLIVELVARFAVYFHAPPGSGEEEVTEAAALEALQETIELPAEALAHLIEGLVSMAVTLGPAAIVAWAENEREVIERHLP